MLGPVTTNGYVDQFGYLPLSSGVDFDAGSIVPLGDVARLAIQLSAMRHPDGHVYPPFQRTMHHETGKRPRRVPHSERPAHLHGLPVSHAIRLDRAQPNAEAARYADAGFVMHFIGFLLGMRCQFHEWWIDGRYWLEPDTDYRVPDAALLGRAISRAYERWCGWQERQRLVAINVLYLHSRAKTYENEWELFQAEYQVIDAIFALARDSGQLIKKVPHRTRLRHLCEHYSIPLDEKVIHTIVRLRNELLHEALWDGRMPGEARSRDSLMGSVWLHKLARRAMLAVLGLAGPYVQSAWWGMGQVIFRIR